MNRAQALAYCLMGIYLLAYQPQVQAGDIDPTNLSIEQLMNSEVTSASRADQKFSDTAAATYVITNDDIQRSGVTNIPDVLRVVPGIHVTRTSTGSWNVTARSLNSAFGNKLLVLLDGRKVYTPIFEGVRWENLDLVLEDIERIEVIRGLGANVWGQNAVNGVINIITKHTEDTQQGMVSVTSGNKEHAIAAFRYGDQLDDNAHYRVFGKFLRRADLTRLQGSNVHDDYSHGRGGFRVDWNSNAGDRLLFQGNGYVSDLNEPNRFLPSTEPPFTSQRRNKEKNVGASILARWEHDFSVASKTQLRFYYEYYNQSGTTNEGEIAHTYDIDFQHDIALWEKNHLNWGFNYRSISSSFSDFDEILFNNAPFIKKILHRFNPSKINLHQFSAFIQDRITFFDDTLQLTLRTKIQHFTSSGWDYQPSVRLLWKLYPEHRVWASFSKASRLSFKRISTRFLDPILVVNPEDEAIDSITSVNHINRKLDSEQVLSYELGYRAWLSNRFSLDLTVFYNDYEDFVPNSLPASLIDGEISLQDRKTANTWGVESAIDWRPIDPIRFQISYSYLHVRYQSPSVIPRAFIGEDERARTDPAHQFSFRGSYDIAPAIAFDVWVRYVHSFSTPLFIRGNSRKVDHVGLDLRLAWRPTQNLEFSIVAQNLTHSPHFKDNYRSISFTLEEQLQRSIYGKIRWSFE